MTNANTTRRVAWIIWGICVTLILSGSVIGWMEKGSLLQHINIICIGIAFSLFGTIGALIVWQRPRNPIGWIFCTVGIGTGITDFSGAYVAYGMVKGHLPLPGTGVFNWLGDTIWPVNWVLLLVFLPLLFPNGGLLTRRWRIVGWLAVTLALLSILAGWLASIKTGTSAAFWSSMSDNFNLLQLPFTIAALVSLVLRFRRAKERERQQIKWLTYGTTIMAVLIVSGIFIFNDPNSQTYTLIFDFAITLLPLSIGISILRNQLYDIDRLINRTLIYGSLTLLLVGIYIGIVVGLQALLHGFTGGNNVAIVGSTLIIAALFQPLHRRLQKIIEKRFYRSKYDAARTIANFSTMRRNEVDLHQLSEQLVTVVQETMQPEHVSLWLRPPAHNVTQRIPWKAIPPTPSKGQRIIGKLR